MREKQIWARVSATHFSEVIKPQFKKKKCCVLLCIVKLFRIVEKCVATPSPCQDQLFRLVITVQKCLALGGNVLVNKLKVKAKVQEMEKIFYERLNFGACSPWR